MGKSKEIYANQVGKKTLGAPKHKRLTIHISGSTEEEQGVKREPVNGKWLTQS